MSRQLIFRGETTYLSYHWYAQLIFPLVQVKKLLQTIYEFLLHLLWSELIYGKKIENDLASLIAFILFCFLSLCSYYLRDYIQIILLICFVIWSGDCWIAKHQYFQKNNKIDISIYEVDINKIVCCLCLPKKQTQSVFASFFPKEINYIALSKSPLLGGAFQEVLDEVWQTEIYLHNGKHFVVDENILINEALLTAKQLAKDFKVEIIFSHSQGNNYYIEKELDTQSLSYLIHQKTLGIKCKKNSRQWHIYTQWQWSNSWLFIKMLFEKAGFLLFIIMMSGLMIRFGDLLNSLILGFQGKEIIIYFTSPLEWFKPNWHWRNILEFTLVLGIFIYQGWQLSRVKHIYITQHSLKFTIDNKVIDKIKTSEIESSLLVNNDRPEILIIGESKALKINGFQQQKSAQVFWAYLDEAISSFQGKS